MNRASLPGPAWPPRSPLIVGAHPASVTECVKSHPGREAFNELMPLK